MPTIYTGTTVYRRNIASQFQRGGQGYRWLDRVRLSMHRACVSAAPARSGELKGAHRSRIRGLNQYAAFAEVWNVAEHASWVHDGTNGPIYPHGDYLWVPRARGSVWRVKRDSVAGQRAQPWMDSACSRIAMSRGAVKISG